MEIVLADSLRTVLITCIHLSAGSISGSGAVHTPARPGHNPPPLS